MMEDKKRISMPATGGSSLLVIFAVLALTVFAVLSVSTAAAEQKLADKAVASVEEYYAADCAAEAILAEIRSGEIPEGVTCEGNLYSYRVPISETRQLFVEVQADGGSWQVIRWQAAAAMDWENDESLPVWDGEVIIEENDLEGEGIWPL